MTNPSEGLSGIPIVLTATIVPQGQGAVVSDPQLRLAEYKEAVSFYLQFAPVILLENSDYPIANDDVLRETARLKIKRFPPSRTPERGKGFQEFEMLDAWLAAEPQAPKYWLKITGRYQILNTSSLIRECQSNFGAGLIIDQLPRNGFARTFLFRADTDFYRKELTGLYHQCDDRTGDWIEHVLFRKLHGRSAAEVRSFVTQPRIKATSGSNGAIFPTGRTTWCVKQIVRRMNRAFDRQYLWHVNSWFHPK